MNLRALLFGGTKIEGTAANAAYALLRIYTGLAMALNHGINKIPPSERFLDSVRNMGFPIPEFFAYAAGASEFFGGLMLAAGIFTRPSALSILAVMLVAGFIRHANDPFGGSRELALTFACIALLFVLVGSGKYGFDELLRRRG